MSIINFENVNSIETWKQAMRAMIIHNNTNPSKANLLEAGYKDLTYKIDFQINNPNIINFSKLFQKILEQAIKTSKNFAQLQDENKAIEAIEISDLIKKLPVFFEQMESTFASAILTTTLDNPFQSLKLPIKTFKLHADNLRDLARKAWGDCLSTAILKKISLNSLWQISELFGDISFALEGSHLLSSHLEKDFNNQKNDMGLYAEKMKHEYYISTLYQMKTTLMFLKVATMTKRISPLQPGPV